MRRTSKPEYVAPKLGKYIIQVEVTETGYPSEGPDSFSATSEILASYALELTQRINAGYRGRLSAGNIAIGMPDNPTQPVR